MEQSATPWSERATQALIDAGYRRGGARAAVIAQLESEPCALSAMEIEAALSGGRRRGVARASIYRILEELEALGLVTRVEVGQGIARFEATREENHHHHLVCKGCGDVIPFEDDGLERSIRRLTRRLDFEVAEHDVVLHGACADCKS
jgi:Fur family ferric uptake transcriptional regulator